MKPQFATKVFQYIKLKLHSQIRRKRAVLFCIALFYVIVAVNSVGYHQEDEHYQLIEFANYKMGWTTTDKLAWEFHEQIRPGLQPLICYLVFSICNALGFNDGYGLVLLLRLLSAGFSFFAITIFINSYKSKIDKKLIPNFILTSYLLWFVPFVAVRFSSENWSGIFFLLALAVIQNDKNKEGLKRFFLIGILLGASILFRYQSGLLVFGMMLCFIFIDKVSLKRLSVIVSGTLIVLLIGFFIDHWLYGNYPITLYNYFFHNIINDVASRYGTSPWYEYILYAIKSPGPIGVFIFLSFFVVLYYNPKNIILWAIIPFILVHTIIPHKELRFLFPIVYTVPLLLMLAYQFFQRYLNVKLASAFLLLLLFFNAAGLIAVATTGASSHIAVANFIHRNYKYDKYNVILSGGLNPFVDWHPPYNTFYSSAGINIQRVNSIWQPDFLKYRQPGVTNLLVMNRNDITGPRTEALLKKYGFEKVYQNIPAYVIPIYDWYNRSLNESVMIVYEFK